jgi:hypothetical protein
MNARSLHALALALALTFAVAGCINGDRRLYEVDLTGEFVAPAMVTGATTIELHHAETFGRGALAHPLGLIERVRVPGPGPVRHTLLYPTDVGSGLVVPGTPHEPTGLAVVSGVPAHALSCPARASGPKRCFRPEGQIAHHCASKEHDAALASNLSPP